MTRMMTIQSESTLASHTAATITDTGVLLEAGNLLIGG
jgi:hypothetical protein